MWRHSIVMWTFEFFKLENRTTVKLVYNGHKFIGFRIYRTYFLVRMMNTLKNHFYRISDIPYENFGSERSDIFEVYCSWDWVMMMLWWNCHFVVTYSVVVMSFTWRKPTQNFQGTEDEIGFGMGVVSTIFYMGSRMPQIYKNVSVIFFANSENFFKIMHMKRRLHRLSQILLLSTRIWSLCWIYSEKNSYILLKQLFECSQFCRNFTLPFFIISSNLSEVIEYSSFSDFRKFSDHFNNFVVFSLFYFSKFLRIRQK